MLLRGKKRNRHPLSVARLPGGKGVAPGASRNRRVRFGLARRFTALWAKTTDRLARLRRRKPVSETARKAGSDTVADTSPRGVDLILLGAALALVGLGLVMVYSSSAVFANSRYGSSTFFLKRDVIYMLVGLVAMYVGWRINYHTYNRYTYPLLLLALLTLASLLVPGLGTRVDGAVRWFRLAGVSLQPSEPAKFALIVYLAYSLAKKRASVRIFSIGFLPHLCVASVMALLLIKQPDLGTAAILMAVTMTMMLVAGTKLSYVVLAVLAAFPVVYQLIVGTPWRLRRLLAFLDPWAYRKDAGYQIAESLISIGSGGMTGLGLGDGRQKLFFLPAAHTDFIFAIIGEELGLVGMVIVALLFAVIVARGLRAALGARDLFGTYLAFGIVALIALQAMLHMSVVLGLVPTKGITLPLVSFGGSALVTNMFLVGVLLNVAARNPAPQPSPSRARKANSNRRRASRVVVSSARSVSGGEPAATAS